MSKTPHLGFFLAIVGAFFLASFAVIAPYQSKDASAESGCSGDTVDRLGPGIAKRARAFLSELKSAVELSDKTKVAGMAKFPLRVSTPAKRLEIKDREEFLYNYDHIFTPDIVAKITDEKSFRCLFANRQGFMVGDGEVWFREVTPGTFRIVTVNVNTDFTVRKPPQKTAQAAPQPSINGGR